MMKVPRYDNEKEFLEYNVGGEEECGRCRRKLKAITWSPSLEAWLCADCRDNLCRFMLGYDSTVLLTRFPQGIGVVEDDPCGYPIGGLTGTIGE